MASLNRSRGKWRIQFTDRDGVRRSIYLGEMSEDDARTTRVRVESLVGKSHVDETPDRRTAEWLTSIGDVLREKLAAVGLVRSRAATKEWTLGGWCDRYIAGRQIRKPNTLRNYKATRKSLVDFLGEGRLLVDVTEYNADEYKSEMSTKHAAATWARDIKRVKQFFQAAVRAKLIPANPFAHLTVPKQSNDSRSFFVDRETTDKVLAACPDAQWRVIVALCRYGGLRCPSEVLAMTWDDVDWGGDRITVHSPKTEHHEGGASRVIPLFPELRACLRGCCDQTEDHTGHVITRYRAKDTNLRTQLLRIIDRAGVAVWPKLFHNLRASRETELAARHPMHVVCKWIGNSATIAQRHYLQVTDADYTSALVDPSNVKCNVTDGACAQNTTTQDPATPRNTARESVQETQQPPAVTTQVVFIPMADGLADLLAEAPPRGVALSADSPQETRPVRVLRAKCNVAHLSDPDVSVDVVPWTDLPESVRHRVAAWLRGAATTGNVIMSPRG